MSMTIVDIEGPSLDRFRDAITHLAEQFESRRHEALRRLAEALARQPGVTR